MSNIQYVNVFQGTGKSTMPQAHTMYAKWNLLKGKAGNLSPSACWPFGSVACSPYSGGLTACYLWNFLGLFPISGQEEVFLGKPRAKKTKIKLGNGNELRIVNESEDMPKSITFNGKEYTLSVKELLQGGELKFF